MTEPTSDDIKELAIKAARWDYAIQRGFWYADNPNVDVYHNCGINFRLWSDPIDREGLEAAVDKEVSRLGLAARCTRTSADSAVEAPTLPTPIYDPDYARIHTVARVLAWSYGWACIAHGSYTRDLDLLLVPWGPEAAAVTPEFIAERLADLEDLKPIGEPTQKPWGRIAYSYRLPGPSFDVRWVDLSWYPIPGRPVHEEPTI